MYSFAAMGLLGPVGATGFVFDLIRGFTYTQSKIPSTAKSTDPLRCIQTPLERTMETYTCRDRVAMAYSGQYADRVPIDLQGLNTGHLPDGHLQPSDTSGARKAAADTIATWRFFQQDVVTAGVLSLLMAQAAGNDCDTDENGALYCKTRVLEEKERLENLSIPDPYRDNPLPFLLEVCRLVGAELGDKAAIRGMVSLPWTVAVQMRGMERLIFDTKDDPDFVHSVMRFCTDYTKALGLSVMEAIGKDAVGLYGTDPSAGCSVISPKLYRAFVKPYHREVVDHFHRQGIPVTFHICGLVDPIAEDLVATGIDGISIDENTSLERMIDISDGKVLIIGNISPLLFAKGTADDIDTAVKACLEIAKDESRYILASGCAIPPATPLENIESFIHAASKYGRHTRQIGTEGYAMENGTRSGSR